MRILAALVIVACLVAANIMAALAPVAPQTDPSGSLRNAAAGQARDSRNGGTVTRPSGSNEPGRRLDLANVTERPLFNPARKPAEPPVAKSAEPDPEPEPEPEPAPAAAAQVPDGLALVAIVSDGGTHAALIRVDGAPYARKVVRGDDVNDWTVGAINPQSMVLEHGGTRCAFVLGKAAPESGPCASRRASESQGP